MDSEPWVISLEDVALSDEPRLGGKAAQLARLHREGFRITPGFCVTVAAYEQFLVDTQLQRAIQMELGRKPFEDLRWEELWDAALRIRNQFATAELPPAVAQAICRMLRTLSPGTPLAVRSSAPGEDSAQRSFAGFTNGSWTLSARTTSWLPSAWSGRRCGRMRHCSIARNWAWIRSRAGWRS